MGGSDGPCYALLMAMESAGSVGVSEPSTAAALTSIQPGGGWCMRLELAWGRLRRWRLRTFRPGYVRRMAALRQGECPNCPHNIIDARDLKFYRNVCGYGFLPEDDRFRWRGRLGFARAGLCEMLVFSLVLLALISGLGAGYALGMTGWIFWPAAVVLLAAWLEVVWFFRDPERKVPDDPGALVSPADGTVTDIGEVEEPDYPGGRAFRIGIFLSVFDVHVNRTPRAGRVSRIQYFPGRFFDARRPEAARQNEQLWVDWEEPGSGRIVRVKQIAGLIAQRIVCWAKLGEIVEAGERYGMIKFGSRTEIYVPIEPGVEVPVKVGDQVYGAATMLARLPQ